MRFSPRREKPTFEAFAHIISVFLHRTGINRTAVRYYLIKSALIGIRSVTFVGEKLVQIVKPVAHAVGKALNFLALSSILQIYFLFLKLRKRVQETSKKGTKALLTILNKHIYHATIAIVTLAALTTNLTTKNLNAEEVSNAILFDNLLPNETIYEPTLIDEGPLGIGYGERKNDAHNDLFASDLIPHIADDADDDSVFTMVEDESAIISPVVSDGAGTTPLRDGIATYTVEAGDTISSIAHKFSVSINTILWQNDLSAVSTIRPGQSISILPTTGVAHTIKSGETILAIAKKYQTDAESIIVGNKLADAGDIRAGDMLIIPNGIKPTAVAVRAPAPRNLTETIKDIFIPPSAIDSGTRFLWPLASSRITQYFTYRHSGLDVGDKTGKPIYAAEAGKIERSGWNRGYGYNIVINHGNGLKTLYGHASKLLANVGDTVSRGDTIALIGSTGRSTGPHLHFEVIVNGRKINPLNYLK